MRKAWIFIFLFFAIVLNHITADIFLGVKAAPIVSFFRGKDYQQYLNNYEDSFESTYGNNFEFKTNLRVCVSFGIFIDFVPVRFLAIQTEALLTFWGGGRYGWKMEDYFYYGSGKIDEKINYFEFPLSLAFKIPVGKYSYINFYSGYSLCIRLGKVKREISSEEFGSEEEKLDSEYMRLFHGVIFGISTEMFVNASIFMLLDLRCFMGISPVVNKETMGIEDWKENYIKLFIGFGKNLGVKRDKRTKQQLRIRYH